MTTPEERQREAELAQAIEFTDRLRTSQDAGWVGVRKRLEAEGLAAEAVAVATIFPDDTNLVFGVVLAEDERCFYFSFEYRRDAPWELIEWGGVSPDQRRAYESSLPYARGILQRARD